MAPSRIRRAVAESVHSNYCGGQGEEDGVLHLVRG